MVSPLNRPVAGREKHVLRLWFSFRSWESIPWTRRGVRTPPLQKVGGHLDICDGGHQTLPWTPPRARILQFSIVGQYKVPPRSNYYIIRGLLTPPKNEVHQTSPLLKTSDEVFKLLYFKSKNGRFTFTEPPPKPPSAARAPPSFNPQFWFIPWFSFRN